MAKADPKRDYYGDLELPPGADVNEINRQYKKLALKYHPDRNPGKEVEYNAKFQGIKSAQEILTDPVQRARYDADRSRLGHAYGYVPPKPGVPPRNPYTATSAFPPPPSRTHPRPFGANASGGASRYSNFPRPSGHAAAREEANPRANAFRAFENMNKASQHGKAPPPTPYRPPPKPSPPKPPPRDPFNTHSPFDARSPPKPPPREESSNAFNGHPTRPRPGRDAAGGEHNSFFPGIYRTQSTKAPKRAGFAPATPGGDEPAAAGSSYFNSTRGSARPGASRAQTTHAAADKLKQTGPLPTSRRANRPDPLSQFKAQNPECLDSSPRISTPYSTTGGEKTYFSSGMLGRSETMREASRPTPPGRHRSASPPRTRGYTAQKKPGFSTRPNSPAPPSQQRTMSDAGVASAKQHARTQSYEARPHSRGHSSSGDDRVRSGTNSPTFMDRMARDGRDRGRRKVHNRVYPPFDPGYQPPTGDAEQASRNSPSQGPPKLSHDFPHGPSPPHFFNPFPNGPSRVQNNSSGSDSRERMSRSPTFTFDVQHDTFQPTQPVGDKAKAGDAEKINTRFSPASWDGKFTSNSPDYFHAPRSTDSRARPTRGRTSPVKSGPPPITQQRAPAPSRTPVMNGVPPIPPPKETLRPASPSQTNFSPEYWAEELKKNSWDPVPHAPPSPGRNGTLNRKRSESRTKTARPRGFSKSSAKRTAIPKPATVSSSIEESDDEDSVTEFAHKGKKREGAKDRNSSSSSAMDIDSSTPPPPKHRGDGTAARPIYVSPEREPTLKKDHTFSPEAAPHLAHLSGGSSTSDLKVGLDDLKHVEPLASSKHGLDNLKDLSGTLPFESRPASGHPSHDLDPRPLMLPRVPKAPVIPGLVTQASWELYLANSEAYLSEWFQFNDKMLGHFNGRQKDVREGLTPEWMGNLGEGERGGYLKYIQGVEEDFRVREHWDVAWERHRDAMRKFGQIREMAIEKAPRVG